METITHLKAKEIREAITQRLRDMEQVCGVKITLGALTWTIGTGEFRIVMNGTTALSRADREVTKRAEWERFCGRFDLKPEDFGKLVKIGSRMYKIEGITSRGSVRLECGGKIFRGKPAQVIMALSNQNIRLARRSEDVIMMDIVDAYTTLSPENLCCDGELRGRAVMEKKRRLLADLARLQREIGYNVTEMEAFDWSQRTVK